MRPRYTLFYNEQGHLIFTFHGTDETLLLTSLPFTDKGRALSRINSMRSLGQRAESFLTCPAPDGKRYFVLRNTRQEVIAQSEMYEDGESLLRAIEAVRRTARAGKLYDLTVQEER